MKIISMDCTSLKNKKIQMIYQFSLKLYSTDRYHSKNSVSGILALNDLNYINFIPCFNNVKLTHLQAVQNPPSSMSHGSKDIQHCSASNLTWLAQ